MGISVFLCSILCLQASSTLLDRGIVHSTSFLYRILLYEYVTIRPSIILLRWIFRLFKLLNNESINILVSVSWYTLACISVGYKYRSAMRMFSFNRYCQIVSKWLYHFTLPPSVCDDSYCSTSSQTLGIVSHFNFSPSGGGVLITHCDFNLYFS